MSITHQVTESTIMHNHSNATCEESMHSACPAWRFALCCISNAALHLSLPLPKPFCHCPTSPPDAHRCLACRHNSGTAHTTSDWYSGLSSSSYRLHVECKCCSNSILWMVLYRPTGCGCVWNAGRLMRPCHCTRCQAASPWPSDGTLYDNRVPSSPCMSHTVQPAGPACRASWWVLLFLSGPP